MGLFSRKPQAKISGEYFASHPKIKGHHKKLYLVADNEGITVYSGSAWGMNKNPITQLAWSEVSGFEYSIETNESDGKRISVTRVATVGVFALLAKKKQHKMDSKTVAILHTTTGDIVLETHLKDDGFSSTISSASQVELTMLEKSNKRFRAFVADRATR